MHTRRFREYVHYKTNSLIISLIIRLELVVRTIGPVVRTISLYSSNYQLSVGPGRLIIQLSAWYFQGDSCALRSFLAPRGQVPCYGTWRNHRTTYRLPPVLPVVQPQIQQHVGASSVISRSTDFSRPHCAALSHLSRCPLNALMPGSETGSLPRSAVGDATAW